MEGSESFKYDPRPKGLRAYRDCDTSDDVSAVFALFKSFQRTSSRGRVYEDVF